MADTPQETGREIVVKLDWATFNVRYRTQSLARPLSPRERAWRTDAQIFLTSPDPSIGIPEVPTDGGRPLR